MLIYINMKKEVLLIQMIENSSRIASFQTSKGDGREVVFILGSDEKSLKIVSEGEMNLLYESNLHVALTRAKKSVYFGLQKNNDDIHKKRLRKIKGSNYDYKISLSNNINIDKIIDFIDKKKLISLMEINGIDKDKLIINNESNKESIDWKYHCIRFACFYYSIVFNIINNFDNKDLQIYAILKTISNLKIQEFYCRKLLSFFILGLNMIIIYLSFHFVNFLKKKKKIILKL